ncbi:MAG: hypothetical protein OXN18_07950 [Gemmatimonadota bacterium]|nr:hypothetical protein [Gemmatimonadota bacterium]
MAARPFAGTAAALVLVALGTLACQTGTRPSASVPEPAPRGQPAAQSAVPQAVRSKADEPNTTDGIYTVQQAERGIGVYNRICSECHMPEDWTDAAFLERWEEASVFRLWYWIYERMPHGNPGSLTREQVTDALTYIFQLNGMPPGDTELADDDDTIDDYWIIWKKP